LSMPWIGRDGAMQIETIAERVALNQHAFREVNERLEQSADDVAPHMQLIPFVCECPDRDCTEITRLERSEYEAVRQDSRTFLVAPGHEVIEVDGVPIARIVERCERFSTMEKVGEAGAIVEKLDRRGGG
jgi:hypothetical protein